jgi:hypothetical protein
MRLFAAFICWAPGFLAVYILCRWLESRARALLFAFAFITVFNSGYRLVLPITFAVSSALAGSMCVVQVAASWVRQCFRGCSI